MATTQTPASSSIFARDPSQAGDTSNRQNEGTAPPAALSSPFSAISIATSTTRPSADEDVLILLSQVPPPMAFTHTHCDVLIKAERACRTQEETLRRRALSVCGMLNGALKETEAKYARALHDVAAEKMRAERLERQVSDAEVEHRNELEGVWRECAAALSDSEDLREWFTGQIEVAADLQKERQMLVLQRNVFRRALVMERAKCSTRVISLEAAADVTQTRYREQSDAHSALKLAYGNKEQKHNTLKRRTTYLVIVFVSILALVLREFI